MILVILLGAPVAAMAVFSLVVVYLSPLWVIASLMFAPFAGWMYERAATAAGVWQDRRTLRRSGMIAGALLVVPWVYMMRDLERQRTGSWVFHLQAVYLLWLLGPTVFFFFIFRSQGHFDAAEAGTNPRVAWYPRPAASCLSCACPARHRCDCSPTGLGACSDLTHERTSGWWSPSRCPYLSNLRRKQGPSLARA